MCPVKGIIPFLTFVYSILTGIPIPTSESARLNIIYWFIPRSRVSVDSYPYHSIAPCAFYTTGRRTDKGSCHQLHREYWIRNPTAEQLFHLSEQEIGFYGWSRSFMDPSEKMKRDTSQDAVWYMSYAPIYHRCQKFEFNLDSGLKVSLCGQTWTKMKSHTVKPSWRNV